jgi:NADPH:quinone reductase-like Zn-dependent oxidoreductase
VKEKFDVQVATINMSNSCIGTWSELAKTTEDFVALKPKNLSMEDSASIPLAAMTALQALRGYPGSLEGKTVFIPAGCTFLTNCLVVRQKLTFRQ